MTGARRVRRLVVAALLGLVLLMAPDSAPAPAVFSLVRVESAQAVGFDDGVVWVLALGSDARPSEGLFDARADAIELIALNVETGAAVALGIPRDSWVDVAGNGFRRINEGLNLGGPKLMASEVQDVTKILPQYVFTTGFAGFTSMVDSIGGVAFRSEVSFADPALGVEIDRGPNRLNGREATNVARARKTLHGGDFERAENHQGLLRAILSRLRAHENEDGFVEAGAVAALRHLDTGLSPAELYRFAQAIIQIDPGKVTTCVIAGTPFTVGTAQVIRLHERHARRLADDASDDAVLQGGC
jgi:LCP family protein required for cell wall assembly